MSRLHFVEYLSTEQRQLLDACIVSHNYVHLNRIKKALSDKGIEIGRSTLHRHIQQMKAKQAGHLITPNQTLVTLLEPSTGHFQFIAVNATAETVSEMLSKM